MELAAVVDIDPVECVQSGEGWVVNSVGVQAVPALTPLGFNIH